MLRFLLLILLFGAAAADVWAQADFRNLDAGRPIAVEDAQPSEFRAIESQIGIPRFTLRSSGRWLAGVESELKWGVLKDTQLGVSSEYVLSRTPDKTSIASRDTQVHVLYNFNQETRMLPAIARSGLNSRSEPADSAAGTSTAD